MGLYRPQFRSLIVRTLKDYDEVCIKDEPVGLYSKPAVVLLLDTAAQESDFGHYLKQLGRGPALGAFQMEPETFRWLRDKYRLRYSPIGVIEFRMLEWNLRAAIIMARLRYRAVRAALPPVDDVKERARYWKRYYNTAAGRGTIDEFITNHKRHVGGR